MIREISVLIITILFLGSCGDSVKEAIDSSPSPSEYQPLKIGSWYIYDVDSIVYSGLIDQVTVDTIQFQLKEEITDTFTDQAGNLNFRIERSKRFYNDSVAYISLDWQISDIWIITKKGQNIERVEENNRFISLINPVKNGTIWDGNVFNFKESWDYNYTKLGEPFEDFGNTVTVNQYLDLINVFRYQRYEEVFAKDVGMISRIRIDVESQNYSDVTIPVLERIEKGYQYFQLINSYYIP
tara:strand:- start:6292 stop:7011 length:720 start_codon:yes stop_codon:yes gene_type:complete